LIYKFQYLFPKLMTEEISKSARKREAVRLQDVGRALTQLKAQDLQTFDLPNPLSAAIEEYRRINSREGGRRQLQYIGRLMRKLDTAAIELQLQHLRGESVAARHSLHQVEHWRDRLISEPHTLTQLLTEHPHIDRQKLRQLLKARHHWWLKEQRDRCKSCRQAGFESIISLSTRAIRPHSIDLSLGAADNNFVDFQCWLAHANWH
jgi:ribosome-associated protein